MRLKTLARSVTVTTAMGLVLVLGACGTMNETTAAAPASDDGEKTLAISFPGATKNALVQSLLELVEEDATAAGWKVITDDPEDDLNKQVNTLTTWVSQDVDVIIAQPIASDAVESVAKQAQDAGVGWISYGVEMDNQDGFVGFDHAAMASDLVSIAADWSAANPQVQPKIALMTWSQIEWGQAREAGLEAAIAEALPGAEVVAKQDALSQSDGLTAMSTVLQSHPEVNMVLAVEETASEGAYQALLNSGKAANDPDLFVGGLDGSPAALRLLQEETFYRGSAAIDIPSLAQSMVDTAVAVDGGQTDVKESVPDVKVVSGDPRIPDLLKLLGES